MKTKKTKKKVNWKKIKKGLSKVAKIISYDDKKVEEMGGVNLDSNEMYNRMFGIKEDKKVTRKQDKSKKEPDFLGSDVDIGI